MEKQYMTSFAQRANILSKKTEFGQTLIYEDHRTILTVLHTLKKEYAFEDSIDIVMFDMHDDFLCLGDEVMRKISSLNRNYELSELYSIVEFDLNGLDDNWVKAGMELGLIGNVFLFNSELSNINFVQEYSTKLHGVRRFYNLGNVWEALSKNGYLTDLSRHTELKDFWDDFGWEYKDAKFNFKKKRRPFVIDIDLDCFTTIAYGRPVAIPDEIIEGKLNGISFNSLHCYFNAASFIRSLVDDSLINTICFESNCCGGIRQAQKIFNKIDEVIFGSQLGD